MKKALAFLLAFMILLPFPPRAETERVFFDSLGREVTVPATVSSVAATGSLAEMLLFALCPDLLAGLTSPWDGEALKFIPEEYRAMPVLGQLYGGKGGLNPESLLLSGAELVIDAGGEKNGMAEDLDRLSAQTGLPVVHIGFSTETMGDAFRTLGALLCREEEAETLAAYCERVYARAKSIAASGEKTRAVYLTGENGLSAVGRGSFHAEVLDLMAENAAVFDTLSTKGTGNGTDLEELLLWDPDVILFAPGSVYESAASLPGWQALTAIQSGRYYLVPSGPYNWMGFPASVQRCLGLLWLGKLLFPDAAGYDLYEEAREWHRLFLHTALTREQYETLTAHAF